MRGARGSPEPSPVGESRRRAASSRRGPPLRSRPSAQWRNSRRHRRCEGDRPRCGFCRHRRSVLTRGGHGRGRCRRSRAGVDRDPTRYDVLHRCADDRGPSSHAAARAERTSRLTRRAGARRGKEEPSMREPSATAGLTLEAADAYCRFLTGRHYENFSVASAFVDRNRRTDLARLYAFCRTTDDLGDESADLQAVPRLQRWRSEVVDAFAGIVPVHPVLYALTSHGSLAQHPRPAVPRFDRSQPHGSTRQLVRYLAQPLGILHVIGRSGRPDGPARVRDRRSGKRTIVGRRLRRSSTRQSRSRRQPRPWHRPLVFAAGRRASRRHRVRRRGARAQGADAARLGQATGAARSDGVAIAVGVVPFGRPRDLRCDRTRRISHRDVRPSVSTPAKLALAVRALAAG